MNKTKWTIDPAHSEVQFKIKHLMINTVTGRFNTFEGTVESESDDFTGAQIEFSAEVNSIDTNMEMRDTHLKSDDFFAAEKFPKISFHSSSFAKKGDHYELLGNFTIRDITKPIALQVEYNGMAKDFYGNNKAGFEISGKISRKEFGLVWNGVTEAGGVVVGDDVKLHLSIQLQQQA
ncbi:MAG: YceI family protein [Chitinophagales bacterium]